MSNPFENSDRSYDVLVNDEGQHSLWPTGTTVPAGWRTVLADRSREECLAHVEAHWTDMRPRSLRVATA
ncbi:MULTISPECIES: MbtH family protein [Streptomyces]|uniref:MbtH family protein n=1 Tax=Streptomyces TaxID=1883 RepID=UPI000375D69B|nr:MULTISPECIES: MbtH family protein [Streptomyces]MYW62397.1 MbtH family NRPS accessory protein [Streptomyces sp. SID8370]MYW83334.1 MbtH family NRPS accessory protein [Streptomyces sp. SID8371]RZD68039.1 MbtH family protein [Streptomyces albidoflavus]